MSNLGNKKIMADNLLYYMNKKGISRSDLCRDLNFKYTTVTGWLVAEKYPRIDKIEIMAHYFGITKADLVEEKPATTEDDGLTKIKNDFIADIKNLTDEDIQSLHPMVKNLLRNKK